MSRWLFVICFRQWWWSYCWYHYFDGENLNFNIIAEGIETEEQLAYLEEVGCDEGQGDYLGKPMSVKGIEAVYLERNKIALSDA